MDLKNNVMLNFYNVEMEAVGSTYDGIAEGEPWNFDLFISELDNEGICKNKIVVFAVEKNLLCFFLYRYIKHGHKK